MGQNLVHHVVHYVRQQLNSTLTRLGKIWFSVITLYLQGHVTVIQI